MRYYLAGKISNPASTSDKDRFTIAYFEKFMDAAHELRIRGYDVINPVELNFDKPNWQTCMRRDIAALMTCEGICLLPDAHDSKGAVLELFIASQLGMQVATYAELLQTPVLNPSQYDRDLAFLATGKEVVTTMHSNGRVTRK